MADNTAQDATTTQAQDATITQAQAATTPAKVETTDAGRIEDLPDWAQALVRSLRKEAAANRKERADAERQAAEAAGEFKVLYEKAQADLTKLNDELRQERIAAAREAAKAKYNLPDAIAERLRGESADDIMADAAEVAKALPARAMPNDAAEGRGTVTAPQDLRFVKRATGNYSGI